MKGREPVKFMDNVRMNTNLTSNIIDMKHVDCGSFQLIWTGAGAAGTFYLKGSTNGSNFTTMKDSSGTDITSTVSGAGSQIWDLAEVGVPYIEVTFTNSAGDGYVSAWFNTKSSGG